MEGPREQCHFLFIEDNSDEAILLEHALSELAEPHGYRVCRNIGEAIAYLSGAGIYGDRARYPLPTVVVSDLMARQTTSSGGPASPLSGPFQHC